jgi:hypothetical protein
MWLNAQPAYRCQRNCADFLERRLARIMHRSLVRPLSHSCSILGNECGSPLVDS